MELVIVALVFTAPATVWCGPLTERGEQLAAVKVAAVRRPAPPRDGGGGRQHGEHRAPVRASFADLLIRLLSPEPGPWGSKPLVHPARAASRTQVRRVNLAELCQ